MDVGFVHTIRCYKPRFLTRALLCLGATVPFNPLFYCKTDEETVFNVIPTEGLNHFLNTELKGGAQVPNWYVGVYEGNYTPSSADTMAAFPSASTECTSYASTTRPQWVGGTVASGQVDNSASVATFAMNNVTAKTLYGDFLSSSSVKGGVTGTLLSAVRYTTPKVVTAGDIWTVTASIQLVSA